MLKQTSATSRSSHHCRVWLSRRLSLIRFRCFFGRVLAPLSAFASNVEVEGLPGFAPSTPPSLLYRNFGETPVLVCPVSPKDPHRCGAHRSLRPLLAPDPSLSIQRLHYCCCFLCCRRRCCCICSTRSLCVLFPTRSTPFVLMSSLLCPLPIDRC